MKVLIVMLLLMAVFEVNSTQSASPKQHRSRGHELLNRVSVQAIEGATLTTGDTDADVSIKGGDKITSANGRFELSLLLTGNLVLYDKTTKKNVWESKTVLSRSKCLAILTLTSRGNLILEERSPLGAQVTMWQTNTAQDASRRPFSLTVQDDGNFVLTNEYNLPYWFPLPLSDALNTLSPYKTLNNGQKLTSANGRFTLLFSAGSLSVTSNQNDIIWSWSSNMPSQQVPGSKFVLQSDKTMAFLGADNKVYDSLTSGFYVDGPFTLKLTNSGALVLLDYTGQAFWRTLGTDELDSVRKPTLTLGQQLTSPSGQYVFYVSPTDLSLCINDTTTETSVWTQYTGAVGQNAVLQLAKNDGNLILSTKDKAGAQWSGAGTFISTFTGKAPFTAKVLDTGLLAIYDSNNKTMWASGPLDPFDAISTGQSPTFISVGQELTSPNQRYKFLLENTNNGFLIAKIVDTTTGKHVWALNCGPANVGARFSIRADGTAAVTNGVDVALWTAPSVKDAGSGPYTAKLLDTGSLVVMSAKGDQKWISTTPSPDRFTPNTGRSSLYIGEKLTSANGQYEMKVVSNQVTECVIFDLSADQPVAVWRSKPSATPDRNARLLFADNGDLVFVDKDNQVIWSNLISVYKPKAPLTGILDNTGTFVVVDSKGATIWSTASRDRLGGSWPLALNTAEKLVSSNGQYELSLNQTLAVQIYDRVNRVVVWSYKASGQIKSDYASFNLLEAGSLFFSAPNMKESQTMWSGQCTCRFKRPAQAVLNNDGAFEVIDADGAVMWTTAPPPIVYTSIGDSFTSGQSLLVTQQLTSSNGLFTFTLDETLSLKIRMVSNGRVLWTNTAARVTPSYVGLDMFSTLTVTSDGRLSVVSCTGKEDWSSDKTASRNGPFTASLNDEGNIVLKDKDGNQVWNTNRDRLMEKNHMSHWNFLSSPNGRYRMTLQAARSANVGFTGAYIEVVDMDTSATLYKQPFYAWSTAYTMYLRNTGRLEMWYFEDRQLVVGWFNDRSWGPELGPYTLVMQDDGVLAVVSSKPIACDLTRVWSSEIGRTQLNMPGSLPRVEGERRQEEREREHAQGKKNDHHMLGKNNKN